MKTIALIAALLCLLTLGSFAQQITEQDGIYLSNSKPYTGLYTTTHPGGVTKFSLQLKNGLKDGEMRVYFASGVLNEIRHYARNQMDGTWTTYNEAGVQIGLANYKAGKKHGEWKVWDDAGQLVYEMNYRHGNKAGTWKKYSANGQLLSERTF